MAGKEDVPMKSRTDTESRQGLRLLQMLEGRWKAQILSELCNHDTARFSTLKKSLPGITNTMLAKSLRELEKDGLVYRKEFKEIPLHVEYSFTEMGRDLLPIFNEINNFDSKHEKAFGER